MILRPYQIEALDAIWSAYRAGLRRVLVALPTGCHARGQGILMAGGSARLVEKVAVGDQVMGLDSKPRTVMALARGYGNMYRIVPIKGDAFVVNEDHILTLIRTAEVSVPRYACERRDGKIIDVSVRAWMSWPEWRKHIYKLFRVPVNFLDYSTLPIDPYSLGILLGDGSVNQGSIGVTTCDEEVLAELRRQAERWNCYLRPEQAGGISKTWYLSGGGSPLIWALRRLDLRGKTCENKHIPQTYKISSRENRLAIIAGLIDTDGSLSCGGYDFISKSTQLANDVAFICRSVGLAAYVSTCEKRDQNGRGGTYYRVSISGNVSIIPCLVARKKAAGRLQKKNVLRTGFHVEQLGMDDYYGFELDGDGRFLLDDFTVTHNTGKTVLFASLPERFRMRQKLLVLAHREELLDQAAAKFAMIAPASRVEIEQAGRRASPEARVIVASVQTLVASGARRLQALDPSEISIIVVDEAHHALAPSYQKIIEYFGLFEPDTKKLLVGVTATPKRGDGVGLSRIFQRIVYERSLETMIRAGYLARIRAIRVRTAIDLDGIRASHGDLPDGELEQAVNLEARNRAAVWAWRQHAAGRPTLAFCAGVQHAQDLAVCFENQGVPARAVWGDMPRVDRAAALASLRDGSVKIICNMGVLTEGFDEPTLSAILLARPTLSSTLLTQMIGRGTRLGVAKSDVLVIDLVDQSIRHSLCTTNDLFDLPGALDVAGLDILEVATRYRKAREDHPWADLAGIKELVELEHVAERVDLFRLAPPRAVEQAGGRLAWIMGPIGREGDYVLPLPDGRRVRIQRDLLGAWQLSARGGKGEPDEDRELYSDFRAAVMAAERLVRDTWPDVIRIVETQASWRRKPATEKQRELLARRKIATMPNLTAGQASWMIAQMGLIRKSSGPSVMA